MLALLQYRLSGQATSTSILLLQSQVDAAVATKIDIDTSVAKLAEDKKKKAHDDKEKKVLRVKKKATAAKFDERADSLKEREEVLLSESKTRETQKLDTNR
jgi:hypothetical protein